MPKLTVLLPGDENERFNAYCREKGYKKSPLVARLIRDHLMREGVGVELELFPPQPSGRPRQKSNRHG